MIDDVERYKVVTSRIQYFNDKIIESFKLYIQLVTALTGGYMWLKTQSQATNALTWARVAAPGLMILIGITIILLIVANLSAWWGHRKVESKLTGGAVPAPVFPKSARGELIMIGFIIITSGLGAWYFTR
jgi:uncharacterized iron-regulated membrane protein